MDRRDFLARLGRAKGGTPPPEAAQGFGGSALGEGPGADLGAEFLAQALAVGCGARRAAGPEEALEMALGLAAGAGAVSVGVHDLGLELNPLLAAAAARAGLNILPVDDGQPGAARLIEPLSAGLTRPEAALAGMGALVQGSRPGGGYLLSLLPPLHLALVREADLLPGLEELPAALADPARFTLGPPSVMSIIAGPSKTGDIEAVMIRGVHGPGRVEVVLFP